MARSNRSETFGDARVGTDTRLSTSPLGRTDHSPADAGAADLRQFTADSACEDCSGIARLCGLWSLHEEIDGFGATSGCHS